MREMICPPTMEVNSSPAIIGVSCRPELVGLRPRTICRKSGRKVIEPKSAIPMMKPTAELTTKMRLRKSDSGKIGSLARRSAKGNKTSRTTPTIASATISVDPHAYVVPPRLVNRTTAPRPPARSAAPR